MTVVAKSSTRVPLVVVAGNPNAGKTTLFNQLTGSDQQVGNYPGITVDRHVGRTEVPGYGRIELADVPGTYSLSARSPEEQIAIQATCGLDPNAAPDAVLVVVDATQLSRHLYLVLQIIESDVPVVVAINMLDALRGTRQELDLAALERELGVPVVGISALRREGTDGMLSALQRVLESPDEGRPGWRWQPTEPDLLENVRSVALHLPATWTRDSERRRDALALWALLSLDETDELKGIPDELRRAVEAQRSQAADQGRQLELEVIQGRYGWIDARMRKFVQAKAGPDKSVTGRVDAVLLHPLSGFLIFLGLMGIIFQSLFAWADPVIGWVELAAGGLADLVRGIVPAGLLQEFLVDGLIAGVGSVVVFLPQILLLFLFIGLMEATGYMARVAFLMDRIMKALGLHGRAFVPMMSGFACAVPAILATRTMERRRDRLLTMMVIPLMTCSARLPVYSLLIAALFPPSDVFGFLPVQGLLMVAMYVFSTVTALIAAGVLGRTLLKGPRVPLILELPPYRLPHLPSVLRLMWQKSRVFLNEAGRVILVCTVLLWLLLSFPKEGNTSVDYEAQRAQARAELSDPEALDQALARLDDEESAERLHSSYGGRLGQALEPVVAPLGFDWKIGIGLIGAFAAREVFVSTLAVVYGVGADADEESVMLRDRIRAETHADGRAVYTPLVGLSLMVFFALACQCMSTLAAVRRETATWRWPIFLFGYMTALAWLASFGIYQGGRLLGFE